jgi:hypothetical protein
MLWTVFIVLLILWLLGFSFHIGGGLIHLVLVGAVVILIVNLVSGYRIALYRKIATAGCQRQTMLGLIIAFSVVVLFDRLTAIDLRRPILMLLAAVCLAVLPCHGDVQILAAAGTSGSGR